MFKREHIIDFAAALAIAALFVLLALHRLDEAVFFCEDELIKEGMARKFLAFFTGRGLENWSYACLVPSRSPFPIAMFSSYIGYPPVYFAALFMGLLGGVWDTLFILRLTGVFFGAATVLCVFFVLRAWAGRAVAAFAAFFLATNNMYIMAARGAFIREEVFQVFCLWFGLALMTSGLKAGRRWPLWAAMFVFGVGLWAKVMFMGFILGAGLGLLALRGQGGRIARQVFFPSRGSALAGLAAFVAGVLPFLLYNLHAGFPVLRSFVRSFSGGYGSVSERTGPWFNCDFLSNLAERGYDAWMYLSGSMFLSRSFNPVFPVLFFCALAWNLYRVFVPGRGDGRGPLAVFLLVAYGFIFVMSSFVLGVHSPEHLIILAPFFELITALFVCALLARARGRGKAIAAAALCLFWLGGQAGPWLRYGNAMDVRRGAAFVFRDERAQIMERMRVRRIRNVVCSPDLGWMLKNRDPSLRMELLSCRDLRAGRDFARELRGRPGQWWAMLSIFDFDRELYAGLCEQGLCGPPEEVLVFRDRDDCAVAFIKLRRSGEGKGA